MELKFSLAWLAMEIKSAQILARVLILFSNGEGRRRMTGERRGWDAKAMAQMGPESRKQKTMSGQDEESVALEAKAKAKAKAESEYC